VNEAGRTFAAVDDAWLANGIAGAVRQIVFAAPGLGLATAHALIAAMRRDVVSITIILDADPDACRIGYGDAAALEELYRAAGQQQFPLRRQPGLRIGLLIVDERIAIWSPTARSVEPEPDSEQPNAIVLGESAARHVREATGAEGSPVLPSQAQIGREPLKAAELRDAVNELERNPPAPFDLSRRTRVFSSKFQFVEAEVRGAEWAERSMKLSSLLVNADLPESLRDLLETRVRPFQATSDQAFDVPHIVQGIPAFDRNGQRIFTACTQAQVMRIWADIRDRYLRHLKGFGWLIAREEVDAFREAAAAFEETLSAWVSAFQAQVAKDEDTLIDSLVASIERRLRDLDPRNRPRIDLRAEVRAGLNRMRVTQPKVRIVLKNVSWESTRDAEFLEALRGSFTDAERSGWFEEYTAARERPESAP